MIIQPNAHIGFVCKDLEKSINHETLNIPDLYGRAGNS